MPKSPARPHTAPPAGQRATATAPRVPWRTAGIGLTSLGTPIGIGAADPLLRSVTLAIELAVAFTIIGTALFGSQAHSERAFRLLRWIANRPMARRRNRGCGRRLSSFRLTEDQVSRAA